MELNNKSIKCSKCGKELKYVCDLTEEELQDYLYINNMSIVASNALDTTKIDLSLFKDGQIYEYFSSVYSQLAKSRYLYEMLIRSIKTRLQLTENIDIQNCKVYIHP